MFYGDCVAGADEASALHDCNLLRFPPSLRGSHAETFASIVLTRRID